MVENLTFHLRQETMDADWAMKDFYGPLIHGLKALGVQTLTRALNADEPLRHIEADQGFHIIHAGKCRHPRVLNSAKAYIPGFYSLDAWGYRLFSSTGAAIFPPAGIQPEDPALLATIRARTLVPRRSLLEQPKDPSPVPDHVIAVFLQSESDREVGETCHLTLREMVRALKRRRDPRQIWIKPHPKDRSLETYEWLGRQLQKDNRIQLFHGNIHDLLAKADCVVTINSAVGIEALVHERPVILCGQSDFHHICETVRSMAEMNDAIARAETRLLQGNWPFRSYLTWFFGQQVQDAKAPDLPDQVLRRIANHGFDIRRFFA